MYADQFAVLPTKSAAPEQNSDDSDGSETLWSCSVVVQEKPYEVVEFSNTTEKNRSDENQSEIKEEQKQKKKPSKAHHSKRQTPLKYNKGVS